MSSYNLKKPTKESEVRKGQYYVWYLGWKECSGLAGREHTEPIAKDLVYRRTKEELPKLTIDISKKELKIYQLIKTKLGRQERLKFPTVPAKDVTYAVQCLPPDEDVVACIFLGYNPTTRRAVHVHVYRCDSPDTAAIFVNHLTEIFRAPEHQDRINAIEDQLVSRNEITPRPKNFMNSYDADSVITTSLSTVATIPNDQDLSDDDADSGNPKSPHHRHSHYEDDVFDREKEINMESLAAELKQRLGSRSQVPILLPPQDYDTLRRTRGNLDLDTLTEEYEKRKCKNQDIVGAKVGHKSHPSLTEDTFRNTSSSSITNGFHEPHSGSSDGSSIGRRDNHRPVEMRHKDLYIPGERQSRGSRGSGEVDDLKLVSPRWKTGSQVYSPPLQPTSPHPHSEDHSGGHRRARSPSPRRTNQKRSSAPPTDGYGAYAENRRSRGRSPTHNEQPRYRSGSRGRYNPQSVSALPGGPQQPARVPYSNGSRGVDVVRLPRQRSRSAERSHRVMQNPNPDFSASMPTDVLRNYTQAPMGAAKKDKKDKDKKKKGKKHQEPTPDYMYPAASRNVIGSVYS